MGEDRTSWSGIGGPQDAEPVDVPRYLASLRRAKGLVVAIVVGMTVGVFALSSALPERYEATARIVMDDRPGETEPADVETVRRRLATVRALLTTRDVRVRAARRLETESASTLDDKVSATVDEDANLVSVRAQDGDAKGAAEIANVVARSFLAMQQAAERRRIARARSELLRALERARRSRAVAEAQAIRERLSEVTVREAAAGSELVLAEAAEAPEDPSSPRAVRNTIFAFFASIFVAVLAALGLGQLAPRVAGTRDLSTLTGAPILGAVARGRRRGEHEDDYDELQAALLLRLPPESKLVVVAGALPDERTSAVAAGLARSFARARFNTLLVSTDMRTTRVHDVLGLPRSPGLVEVLDAGSEDEMAPLETLEGRVQSVPTNGGQLSVLAAGAAVRDATRLLSTDAFSDFVLDLERSDYRPVVLEGPPLLDSVHGQVVARYAHALLVVCDPERLSPAEARGLGELLRRLDPLVSGLVALAGRGVHSHPTVIAAPPRERSTSV